VTPKFANMMLRPPQREPLDVGFFSATCSTKDYLAEDYRLILLSEGCPKVPEHA